MMKIRPNFGSMLAGAAAGAINGLFGAGGGMVLVPLLTLLTDLAEEDIFPTSVSVILPICITSLIAGNGFQAFSFTLALPYLLGGCLGGVVAGLMGNRIPVLWLHRGLGILILFGGVRYLC